MSQPEVRPELVSLRVAASLYGVTERTIRRRIADGSVQGFRLGPKLLRVDVAELDALLRPVPSASVA